MGACWCHEHKNTFQQHNIPRSSRRLPSQVTIGRGRALNLLPTLLDEQDSDKAIIDTPVALATQAGRKKKGGGA